MIGAGLVAGLAAAAAARAASPGPGRPVPTSRAVTDGIRSGWRGGGVAMIGSAGFVTVAAL